MVVEFRRCLDLTHLPVFTIDPEGSLDLDDALHCLKKESGRDDSFRRPKMEVSRYPYCGCNKSVFMEWTT